jgi:ABC-2 type transport system ATP-binding protein
MEEGIHVDGTITVDGLTKRFGSIVAVNDLSFTARPGRVTGFLGPNGAGKSTTLRALVDLVRPTSGSVTIGGKKYTDLDNPAAQVGTHFGGSFHPGRTALDHLRVYAPLVGVDDARCAETLDAVGLTEAAKRRVGGFSLGMKQRLGLATALLGRPRVLVLDESANGLDPAGVRWLREFLRAFAADGGTVLLSSHLLSEVEQTVDDVVIVSRGTLRHQSSLAELRQLATPTVSLRSPNAEGLRALVTTQFADAVIELSDGYARLSNISGADAGAAAHKAGLELHELAEGGESLESVFLNLTEDESAAGEADATSEEVAA